MSTHCGQAPFSRCARDGFTLIELLVASAITVLVAGIALGVASTTLNNWSRSQGVLTTGSAARSVLDRLAQDLQGALYRDDGSAWLAATVQPDASASGAWVNGAKPVAESLNPAAPNLADARFGVAGSWLRFFTTAQGADIRTHDPAAPVAVSYQIIRRAATPSDPACHYLLYRAEVTPSAIFSAGYDLSAPAYITGSDTDGVAGNIVTPGIRQVMADNVIDLGIRLYGEAPATATDGPALQQTFSIEVTDIEHLARLPPSANDPGSGFPVVADLLLRILTDEGARRIAALESGQITGDWWAIATANSRVFTRRVVLKAGPF